MTLYVSLALLAHKAAWRQYLSDVQVCAAIKEVANRLVGKEVESLFANMGKTWEYLVADSQLRWSAALSSMCLWSILLMFQIRLGAM